MLRLGFPRASYCLPLLGSVVGSAVESRIVLFLCMGSFKNFSGVKGLKSESSNIDYLSKYVRFLILSESDTAHNLASVSPSAVHKGIIGIGGEPKSIKKTKVWRLFIYFYL
ncbi:hypothetical protein AVEN_195241-1 [Araneus ventricosus]|uniref:Uncharacterized protein n=1 Tax=Araneus ventricosus TaxID=182803 RepID=A0A4Y2AQL7_ARAVE|nr:hypothetical protein AVEN_195241-1 [Araneus ventricosus]